MKEFETVEEAIEAGEKALTMLSLIIKKKPIPPKLEEEVDDTFPGASIHWIDMKQTGRAQLFGRLTKIVRSLKEGTFKREKNEFYYKPFLKT